MKNMVLDFFKSQAKPKVKIETSIALIAVEILFVPSRNFGAEQKDCNGKQEYGNLKMPKPFAPKSSTNLSKRRCVCVL